MDEKEILKEQCVKSCRERDVRKLAETLANIYCLWRNE